MDNRYKGVRVGSRDNVPMYPRFVWLNVHKYLCTEVPFVQKKKLKVGLAIYRRVSLTEASVLF